MNGEKTKTRKKLLGLNELNESVDPFVQIRIIRFLVQRAVQILRLAFQLKRLVLHGRQDVLQVLRLSGHAFFEIVRRLHQEDRGAEAEG